MLEDASKGVHLKVVDVVKIYGSGPTAVQALRGVSLEVGPGEIVAVMGPSGSGKTTLLNIIGGIDRPTAGKVIVDGREVSGLPEDQLRVYRLYKVGYIFQFFNLIPTLTVLDNVILPMIMAGVSRGRAVGRAMQLLKLVGLADKAHRLPEELSGGERQRVAIAVALANDPPLILADEPTGELDIVNAEKVVKLLVELARTGKTVIVATHDPRVARMTDRIYMLEDGRITGVYTPEKLAGPTAIAEIGVERSIVEYLRRRIKSAEEEMRSLEKMYREGRISAEEFVERYRLLKETIRVFRSELNRIGAVE